ncbi:5-oxoprolinase subunit PxpB [Liquorilactobacillus satsumensis]|uniref:Allophanate hydrolase n=1 Tax=Liquorilactobacillus satsumensis DSM 16230 = JCM 12392 TaxID=1423801 RepID=A0A0R1UV23_9LACO|nr:5-oxoprolinase subunit PxpB [Liquorilactobacillus satsumensis]KRL96934.1 allophanate hydrolase [Liquorilactobacillus satsumensis DSM 16230 = JCM 12392]MCC7667118.1 allophanate hydrolase subunit 1 [Liquorilactobacillus satsumensis]MCP9357711.1 5-oxoprolinase subunit PxpB [Liquorilactobacillus satsumensis]MCP9371523.1 5-oxoprolinase subunit PxpB [Liquorilactobacillus satsumensis]
MLMYPYNLVAVGEQAMNLVFPEKIDVAENQTIQRIAKDLRTDPTFALLDAIPAYHTLTLYFDTQRISEAQFRSKLTVYLHNYTDAVAVTQERVLELPVCYTPEFGPDLKDVAAFAGLSIPQLIQMHTQNSYFIYMMGFLPGFAYMGFVPDQIAMPRLNRPRAEVPAGSVGIAGKQTGMYPVASPAGWRIIGRTPLKLYDPHAPLPKYQPGDRIQFKAINRQEYERIKTVDQAGKYHLNIKKTKEA